MMTLEMGTLLADSIRGGWEEVARFTAAWHDLVTAYAWKWDVAPSDAASRLVKMMEGG